MSRLQRKSASFRMPARTYMLLTAADTKPLHPDITLKTKTALQKGLVIKGQASNARLCILLSAAVPNPRPSNAKPAVAGRGDYEACSHEPMRHSATPLATGRWKSNLRRMRCHLPHHHRWLPRREEACQPRLPP